jgi:hypothetical protein
MYQQRGVPSCAPRLHLEGLVKIICDGRLLPVTHVTRLGQRECIHLSPAERVRRLRMCVATACRPTKNDYDGNAARHSSSAPGSGWPSQRAEPALACAKTAVPANDAQADLLNSEGVRS